MDRGSRTLDRRDNGSAAGGSEAFTGVGRPESSAGFQENINGLHWRSGDGVTARWLYRAILLHISSQLTSVGGLASSKMLPLGRVNILYL